MPKRENVAAHVLRQASPAMPLTYTTAAKPLTASLPLPGILDAPCKDLLASSS